MLDIEVGWVVEDSHDLVAVGSAVGCVGHGAVGRDGNGVERDLLVRGRRWGWPVGGDFGHYVRAV